MLPGASYRIRRRGGQPYRSDSLLLRFNGTVHSRVPR